MSPGERVAGRFRLERRAGHGGMGEVWRAVDEARGIPVAVKLLLHATGDAGPRFLRETRVLAELHHDAVVEYVAHGVGEDGTPWLAMEWIDGVDLAARLDDGPALGTAASLALVRRIAVALGAAHRRGIVHRDVKPGNVMLPGGRPEEAKLVDFGVARVLSGSQVMTRAGITIGTPGYMAPEQARGAPSVDARADVFALGCVLFECLTGRPVFIADTMMGLLAKIVFEDAPRVSSLLPDVAPALDDLVARLVAKKADLRPRDGHEVAEALDRVRLDAPAAEGAPRREALTGRERRVVSVLAVGTKVERATTPEAPAPPDDATQFDAAPLGAGPFARVQARLSSIGGNLERLADGSLVWAIEGMGTASDQALRAAHAALAVRGVLPDERIAVATGWAEAAASVPVPVGEAIDRVVALVRAGAVAPPAIALDDVTADLVRSQLAVERHGAHALLVGLRSDESTRTSLLGRAAPFVGRDRDLAAIEGLVVESADEAEAAAVLVIAPAGAGKSRLRRELCRRIAATHHVLIGAPDGIDEGAEYGVVIALLRDAARVAPGAAALRLESRIRRRLGDAPDASWTATVLAELAGQSAAGALDPRLAAARADPRLWGDQVHRAVLQWLEAEVSAGPLLLVLEDMHAADRASLNLTGAALSALAARPLAVLGLGRAELRARLPEGWGGRRPTVLELAPLGKKAARAFVREALGDVDDAVVDRMVQQAEGSPFALEELVRAHAEGRDEVPKTLVAMVQSRLDALDATSRRTLRAASVLGRSAPMGAVGALLGDALPAGELGAAVDDLVRRELLAWDAADASGEPTVGFRVEAIREAAYASLTDRDRTLGHHLAAEWLDARGPADAVRAADHFLRAGEPARAIPGLALGAERALAANDLRRALALADRALEAGARGEDRGLALLRRAQAHGWLGEVRRAHTAVAQAIGLLPPRSQAWCWAITEETVNLVRLGDGESLGVRVAEILAALGDDALDDPPRTMLAAMSTSVRAAGFEALADELLARAERGLSAAPDPTVRARIAQARARRPAMQARPTEWIAGWEEAVRALDLVGDRRQSLLAGGILGMAASMAGRREAALADLPIVIADADRLALPYVAASARHILGVVLTDAGRPAEAIPFSRAALVAYQDGDERMNGGVRLALARALGLTAALQEAEEEARRAIAILKGLPGMALGARAVLAEILGASGRLEEALAEVTEARRLLDQQGMVEWGEMFTRRVQVALLRAAGKGAEADAFALEARAILEARAATIEDPAWRRAYLDLKPDHFPFTR